MLNRCIRIHALQIYYRKNYDICQSLPTYFQIFIYIHNIFLLFSLSYPEKPTLFGQPLSVSRYSPVGNKFFTKCETSSSCTCMRLHLGTKHLPLFSLETCLQIFCFFCEKAPERLGALRGLFHLTVKLLES